MYIVDLVLHLLAHCVTCNILLHYFDLMSLVRVAVEGHWYIRFVLPNYTVAIVHMT